MLCLLIPNPGNEKEPKNNAVLVGGARVIHAMSSDSSRCHSESAAAVATVFHHFTVSWNI